MTRFLLIRHAESTMNAAGLWQGRADPPLSHEGRAQARALAEALGADGCPTLHALVASDLRRALETAAILGERLGLAPEPVPALREWDVGAWSGLPKEEIVRRWPQEYGRVRAGDLEIRPGGGESRGAVAGRVRAGLAGLARRFPEGRVAVVTHLGVLRTLQPRLRLPNAGTFWFEREVLGETPGPRPALLEDVL